MFSLKLRNAEPHARALGGLVILRTAGVGRLPQPAGRRRDVMAVLLSSEVRQHGVGLAARIEHRSEYSAC